MGKGGGGTTFPEVRNQKARSLANLVTRRKASTVGIWLGNGMFHPGEELERFGIGRKDIKKKAPLHMAQVILPVTRERLMVDEGLGPEQGGRKCDWKGPASNSARIIRSLWGNRDGDAQ